MKPEKNSLWGIIEVLDEETEGGIEQSAWRDDELDIRDGWGRRRGLGSINKTLLQDQRWIDEPEIKLLTRAPEHHVTASQTTSSQPGPSKPDVTHSHSFLYLPRMLSFHGLLLTLAHVSFCSSFLHLISSSVLNQPLVLSFNQKGIY